MVGYCLTRGLGDLYKGQSLKVTRHGSHASSWEYCLGVQAERWPGPCRAIRPLN